MTRMCEATVARKMSGLEPGITFGVKCGYAQKTIESLIKNPTGIGISMRFVAAILNKIGRNTWLLQRERERE